MANRTWGKLLLTALGVSLLAGAGQLGIAFGFGVVRLTGAFTGGTVNQWPAQLAWIGWFAANAAVVGAVLTERLARRDGPLTGTGRQLAVAGAAAVGATVVAPLCMQPARAAELISVDPVWAVAICAVLGAGAGAGAALAVLVRPPLGWNMALVAGVVWLLALVSVVPSVTATGPLTTVRLGVLEPAWLSTAAAQRLAMLILPLVALLAGATTGAVARWRGHPPLIGGLTGVAGPTLLAFAYLAAGPGGGVDRYQTTPYYGALLAVAAGALGSAAAALLRWPLVERAAMERAGAPGAAGAIEPTDILRPLPAGPALPRTAATTPPAGTAGDAGRLLDDTGTPAGAGDDATGTTWGGRTPETSGGPTPAHWDWPMPGTSAGAAAATTGSTGTPVPAPVDPDPLAGNVRSDRHRASAPVPPAPVEVTGHGAAASAASSSAVSSSASEAAGTAGTAGAGLTGSDAAARSTPAAGSGPSTGHAAPAAPAGPSTKRARAARAATPADGAVTPATGTADAAGPATPAAGAARTAAPADDEAGRATPDDGTAEPTAGAADARMRTIRDHATAARPGTPPDEAAQPAAPQNEAAQPATPKDEPAWAARSTDDAGSGVAAGERARTGGRAKATEGTAPTETPDTAPAAGETAPRPRRGRRTKATPAKATGAAPRAADEPAAAETTPLLGTPPSTADRPTTATSSTPLAATGRASVASAAAGPAPTGGSPAAAGPAPTGASPAAASPAPTGGSPAPDITDSGRSDPVPAAGRAPVPSGPPPAPPTPAVPARPAPAQVGPDSFASSRPGPTPVTPPRPTPARVGPEPFAALPPLTPAQPGLRPVASDPFTPPAPGSAHRADEGVAEAAPRPRHRAPLPDLNSPHAWDAFATARRGGPTEARPVESHPTGTDPAGGDATPGAATAPLGAATGEDPTPSVADRLAAAFSGADGRPAGTSSPTAAEVAGEDTPADHGGPQQRPEPKRRGLFRRNRSRSDQADTSADAEPLPAQDEEFVDWVTGLSKPLPDNEPEQESGRRSLRSTGRHHRD